jgi:hypothetical protein
MIIVVILVFMYIRELAKPDADTVAAAQGTRADMTPGTPTPETGMTPPVPGASAPTPGMPMYGGNGMGGQRMMPGGGMPGHMQGGSDTRMPHYNQNQYGGAQQPPAYAPMAPQGGYGTPYPAQPEQGGTAQPAAPQGNYAYPAPQPQSQPGTGYPAPAPAPSQGGYGYPYPVQPGLDSGATGTAQPAYPPAPYGGYRYPYPPQQPRPYYPYQGQPHPWSPSYPAPTAPTAPPQQ